MGCEGSFEHNVFFGLYMVFYKSLMRSSLIFLGEQCRRNKDLWFRSFWPTHRFDGKLFCWDTKLHVTRTSTGKKLFPPKNHMWNIYLRFRISTIVKTSYMEHVHLFLWLLCNANLLYASLLFWYISPAFNKGNLYVYHPFLIYWQCNTNSIKADPIVLYHFDVHLQFLGLWKTREMLCIKNSQTTEKYRKF